MSRELTDAEVKALTELSYKKSIKKGNKMSNEFYMKGKEVGLGSSDGKFDTVYINIQDWNEIQKKLEALEIIKSKRIDVDLFFDTSSYGGLEEYNEYCCEWAELTQDEYDLLKEELL